ncbi:AAA family ATPase [Muricoccus vinaceus]|uniref:AAA family ATPase n=1 Tax=Muricoccus vinaceus TaxID=424704 RepID=A0ABV6INM0_9PROT
MYNEYYGFREAPFQMTPNARLFFPSSGHSRAERHLLFGLSQGEGFVVVTGEVGAGKTTLVERLCARLDPSGFAVARIATTQVAADDLLALAADAFGAPMEGSKANVLRAVGTALQTGPQRHVLIVDEAQALPFAALEELRMLSNLTGEQGQPLLQIILLGQPQLRRTLSSPDLDQLRQRILASYHLTGLSPEETHAYVEHRLRAVGWDGRPNWEPEALDSVHRHSAGIPRRINRLCSRVLLAGALEETWTFTSGLVESTAQELEDDLGTGARGAVGVQSFGDGDAAEIARRLGSVEGMLARHDRVLGRLADLFNMPRGKA